MGPVHEFGNTNRPNADTFIGADVPANLVVHYFVIVIQSRSIHIGIVNLKQNHIVALIHILANVFYGLHRTAELNINMSMELFDCRIGPLCVLLAMFTYAHTIIDQIAVLTNGKWYFHNVFVYILQKHRAPK